MNLLAQGLHAIAATLWIGGIFFALANTGQVYLAMHGRMSARAPGSQRRREGNCGLEADLRT